MSLDHIPALDQADGESLDQLADRVLARYGFTPAQILALAQRIHVSPGTARLAEIQLLAAVLHRRGVTAE